mmetsp:Transcript_3625/g.13009  ORF Transcript_3625/g.13009 Transcript_3625/m.13009 type:complete len:217 (-) Transcript_3625:705-1355(-)
MGLISSTFLPSILLPVSLTAFRYSSANTSSNARSKSSLSMSGVVMMASRAAAAIMFLSRARSSLACVLFLKTDAILAAEVCRTSMASSRPPPARRIFCFRLPTSSFSCSCGSIRRFAWAWAKRNAFSISSLGTSLHCASIIIVLVGVAAYITSKSLCCNCAMSGFTISLLLTLATRTQPIGPSQGMSEMVRAALAAFIHSMSGSCVVSANRRFART